MVPKSISACPQKSVNESDEDPVCTFTHHSSKTQ